MEAPVGELAGEFVREARVGASGEGDVFLQGLIDDFQSRTAMSKRDMRRMLEKDAASFLQSSCRILKASTKGPGAEYLIELVESGDGKRPDRSRTASPRHRHPVRESMGAVRCNAGHQAPPYGISIGGHDGTERRYRARETRPGDR